MQKDLPTTSKNKIETNHKVLETEMQKLNIPETEKDTSSPKEGGKKEEMDVGKALKKNLMFGEKDISIFRICMHLSYKEEYIFMLLGLIGSIGSGVAMPLMAFLTGDAIGTYSETSDGNTADKNMSEMVTFYSEFKHDAKVMVNKFLFIGIGVFVVTFLNNFMWQYAGLRQMHHLKEKYFAKILEQEQGWFDQHNAFEFATKVQVQLEQIEMGVGEKFGQVLEMVTQFIAGLVIAFTTSWELTLIMLTISPCIIICLILLIFSVRRSIVLSRKVYEVAGGIAEEVLYNIKTVVSFSNFKFEKERFDSHIDRVHELNKEGGFRFAACTGGVIFFLYSTYVVGILYAKKLLIDGAWNSNTNEPFKSGDVMTVNMATSMAIMSIGVIAPNIMIIQEACVAASDYFTLVDRKPQIDESNSTFKPPRDTVKGKIEFKNITFIYPSDEKKKKVLNGLNLLFEPGKKVALVGESGCGKSTTVNLIERLYDTTEGEVLVDDVNVRNYDLKYLRSLIGYVQQEPVLFNRSIRDNLLFGREEMIKREISNDVDTLIKNACEESYAREFIEKNPEQYQYTVGIKGSKLSGGQKQRIAIARAILAKPKILILDEATSALDNKSEKEVQRALDNISKSNVTTVIIAHRLSTIKNADLIYAIKDGKVLEQGTHQQLLDLNGYYAGLVRSQLAQDELEQKEELYHQTQMEKKKKSSMKQMSSLDKKNSKSIQEQQMELDIQKAENEGKPTKKKAEVDRMRLIRLLKNNKFDVALGTFGAFATGAINPVVGLILSKAINGLSDPDNEVRKTEGTKYALLYLLMAFLSGLLLFFKIWKFRTIGSILCCSMRKIIINKYLYMDMGFFDEDENAPGALLSKLSIDTTQLTPLTLTIFGDAIQTIGVIITGFALGFSYDWRLTLMALCFVPFIIASQIVVNQAKQAGRASYRKINVEAGGILSECVVNTKTIYSFNFQKTAVRMYLDVLDQAKREFLRDSFMKGFLIGIGLFAMFANKATMFHYSANYIIDGSLKFEDMNICINVMVMLCKGCADGLRGVADFKKAKLAFVNLFTTIDTVARIDVTEEGNEGKVSPANIKGRIEFKNVTFAYPTKPNVNILKNISFVIEPGQAAALVGYSGCGKSTIIQLLERFYDVEEGKGEILIDGVNIKEYNLPQLRKKIGLVSQEPVLFKRSVYENILYGKLTADRDEVLSAAKRACIEKFFNKKDLGTKEDPVSGGEKQRLAIARAFLKDPTILLLDEATSALDKESEIEVQKSIYELQKSRTSVSIAHRLSTIVYSDVIFVLENGKIIEKGKHDDLMKLGGKYATLYKYSNTS